MRSVALVLALTLAACDSSEQWATATSLRPWQIAKPRCPRAVAPSPDEALAQPSLPAALAYIWRSLGDADRPFQVQASAHPGWELFRDWSLRHMDWSTVGFGSEIDYERAFGAIDQFRGAIFCTRTLGARKSDLNGAALVLFEPSDVASGVKLRMLTVGTDAVPPAGSVRACGVVLGRVVARNGQRSLMAVGMLDTEANRQFLARQPVPALELSSRAWLNACRADFKFL